MAEEKLTHWKKLTDPNYLGVWDMTNEDLIVTIASVAEEKVIGPGGKEDVKPVMRFKEKNIKPLILNKVNQKQIAANLKTPYIENWVGKRIQLYGDPNVKFGREVTGGVRVRNFLPKASKTEANEILCVDCNKPVQGKANMNAEQLANYTQNKYGRTLCPACATAEANKLVAEQKENDVL